MLLDVPSSKFPGRGSGLSHDLNVDQGEFWPFEVWPVDIKGVLFPSVLELEELSRTSLILVWIDVSGDIGRGLYSDSLGDVLIDEGIGVAGRVGIVV